MEFTKKMVTWRGETFPIWEANGYTIQGGGNRFDLSRVTPVPNAPIEGTKRHTSVGIYKTFEEAVRAAEEDTLKPDFDELREEFDELEASFEGDDIPSNIERRMREIAYMLTKENA